MNESKIHYIHSSTIAKQRLERMKKKDTTEETKEEANKKEPQRLFNHFPINNNQLWENNHNPLSSKGD